MPAPACPDASLLAALHRAGLVDAPDHAVFEALSGGVSSDIWKVTTVTQSFCVKRALAKLKVAADWTAPVERNRYEVAWMRVVRAIVPEAVPEILLHDENEMLCAMSYLDPASHRLWKTELRHGRAEPAHAAEVGRRLGRIHAATAADTKLGDLFPPNDIFHAIRLEPYLEATANRHPDLRDILFGLSRRTGAMRLAMIHGDISPKNILLGPKGPVFLDAECACIGDPAFDLAFCLNHLLLKCLWTPSASDAFQASFTALVRAYLEQVNWEETALLDERAASLLPGLFLARVDGKSPVEYIQQEEDKERVRRCARALLVKPPLRLAEVLSAWERELHL